MKNKGFTLVELLAVIIILGLLLLITMISVNSILNSSKESLSETQKKRLEDAAEVYYLSEGMSRDSKCVSVEYLVWGGYVNSNEVLDPKTREPLEGSIAITYDANRYSYEYQDDECSMQVFNPQYYSSSTNTLKEGESFSGDKSSYSPSDKSIYLGLDLTGEKISSLYVCFTRNDEEYCLKGNDVNEYETNTEVLEYAFRDNANACTIENNSITCTINEQIEAKANYDGSVSVTDKTTESSCSCSYNGDGASCTTS